MHFFLKNTLFKSLFAWIFIIFCIIAFEANKGVVLLLLFLSMLGIISFFNPNKRQNVRAEFFSLFSIYPPIWLLLGGLFLLYILMSSFWAIDPFIALKSAVRIVFFICISVFAFVYIQTSKNQDFLQARKGLLIGFGILASLLFINVGSFVLKKYLHIPVPYILWLIRDWDFLTKEGFFLGFFFWVLGLYFSKELSPKNLWILGLGVTFICGFLPQRAACLSMGLSLLIYTFVYYWPKKASWFIYMFLILGITFPFFGKYLFVPKVENILFLHVPQSWQHRFYIWNFVSNSIMEKPLFGWGFDASRYFSNVEGTFQFYTFAEPTISKSLRTSLLPLHPHNGFLQLWLEEGLIGVLLFLSMVGSSVKWFLRMLSSNQEKAFFMGGLGMLFIPFCVSFGIWQTWWLSMWVWYLIFWEFYKKTNKNKEKKISH